jgi:hypothetical protein
MLAVWGEGGALWGVGASSVCSRLIDDEVENVAPTQIALSPAPAKRCTPLTVKATVRPHVNQSQSL